MDNHNAGYYGVVFQGIALCNPGVLAIVLGNLIYHYNSGELVGVTVLNARVYQNR